MRARQAPSRSQPLHAARSSRPGRSRGFPRPSLFIVSCGPSAVVACVDRRSRALRPRERGETQVRGQRRLGLGEHAITRGSSTTAARPMLRALTLCHLALVQLRTYIHTYIHLYILYIQACARPHPRLRPGSATAFPPYLGAGSLQLPFVSWRKLSTASRVVAHAQRRTSPASTSQPQHMLIRPSASPKARESARQQRK
ncbi:hypothetical protein CDD83_7262 [Cordyceps sp. RAO-2017]|nr:hypothetical protein CDD83_7262 [Cordyceps sp. RAO-2017]